MIKTALLVLTFLIITSPAFAESSATVKINNSISGSSTSIINSETNIRVETNGHVTSYSSNEPGNIEVNSINGKSELKINGVIVSQAPTQIQTSPTKNATPSPTHDEKDSSDKNIFEVFENLFRVVFSLLV